MVSKIRPYREIGISTFEKKFLNCVVPWILDYCSEVLGLQNFDSIKTASFVLTWAFTCRFTTLTSAKWGIRWTSHHTLNDYLSYPYNRGALLAAAWHFTISMIGFFLWKTRNFKTLKDFVHACWGNNYHDYHKTFWERNY